MPKKIKNSLENCKEINKDSQNIILNSFINECLNIENSIKEIKCINENINKYNSVKDKDIKFYSDEDILNKICHSIKEYGKIGYNSFSFKKCPINISENRKYIVTGKNNNIITKTGTDVYWMGTICENVFKESKIYTWKIKIIKAKGKIIMVGAAPIDFDINSSTHDNCGWYLRWHDSYLRSGPPYNYGDNKTNLKIARDEIKMILDLNKRSLKFIIDNEDKGEQYLNVPMDKPITPAVCLYHKNDSVEIICEN